MPLTVKQARVEERLRLQQQVFATQQQLVDADNDLSSALEDAASATKTLALLQSAESTIRQQLAVARMPGLIDQLEAELEANLLLQRPQHFKLADAQDRSAQGQRARQRLAATLDRLRAQLAQAEAAIALAARDEDQAQPWRAALALKSPAVVALAKDPAVQGLEDAAMARVKRLLGDKQVLVDLVAARYTDGSGEQADRRARLEVAIDTANAVQEAAGPAGAVLASAETYARAREEVRTVAEESEARLAWIEVTYRLAASTPGLQPGVQSRIDTRATDASTPAKSPAKLLGDLHRARAVQRSARTAFERVARPKEALDDAFDRSADASVKTEREAVTDADEAFATAETAWKPNTMKASIDAWEVAVPPPIMLLVNDVLRARARRHEIAAIDPAAVAGALDSADTAHADALVADIEARVAAEELNAEVLARMDEVAALAAVADQRVAALVRGDE
jgi:hypothetical protein